MPVEMALLEAAGISKHFGGITALTPIDVEIDEGEFVGLVGQNGAGKTTLFNCLLGIEHPDTGTVAFDGGRIDELPTYRRARLGIGRTFQRLELFAGMTPREHFVLTARMREKKSPLLARLSSIGRPVGGEKKMVESILELVGLSKEADVPVEALSLGHGRLVELGRALIGEPRLLMLDEPSSGLDAEERQELVDILRRVHSQRHAAILLVEHDLEMVSSLANRLLVLDSGRLIADGPTSEVLANSEVRRTYLGRVSPVARRVVEGDGASSGGEPVLELHEVSASYGPYRALFSVSFAIAKGSAVALIGPNGSGKSSVARVCTGLVPATAGTIHLGALDVTRWPAWKIARDGIGHVPEGRSVLGSLTVEENLELAYRVALGRHHVPDAITRAYETYPRLGERRDQLAGTLSGGEQRMLAVARVLSVPMKLLIVDELSLGLAPSAVDEVYDALTRVREHGTALLLIEQHVEWALELVERAVVLSHGTVVFEGPAADARAAESGALLMP
ncbi:MAG: ATP-binding cassette domain-containing protein [Acidimicrobiales bacterium]